MFVSGFPLLQWIALIAFGGNFLAAWRLYRGRPGRAFAALLPFMLIVAVLAVFAFRDVRFAARTGELRSDPARFHQLSTLM
jgi:hypothetical protein